MLQPQCCQKSLHSIRAGRLPEEIEIAAYQRLLLKFYKSRAKYAKILFHMTIQLPVKQCVLQYWKLFLFQIMGQKESFQ